MESKSEFFSHTLDMFHHFHIERPGVALNDEHH